MIGRFTPLQRTAAALALLAGPPLVGPFTLSPQQCGATWCGGPQYRGGVTPIGPFILSPQQCGAGRFGGPQYRNPPLPSAGVPTGADPRLGTILPIDTDAAGVDPRQGQVVK